MSIKHILVHLDHTSQCRSRLEYSIGMAHRQQAFLTGCYAVKGADFNHKQSPQAQLREMFLVQAEAANVPAQ